MYKISRQSKGLISHGISTCQGCGLESIFRNVLDVLGEDTVFVIPPGCAAMFSGTGIEASMKVAGVQGNLENTAAIATGVSAGLRQQGNHHTKVVGFAGDGGTVDIGLQSLSGAMERNEDILYICYDNEAYMNTGIQGSGSTPMGAYTTTTPGGKPVRQKDFMRIVMAHNIPYAATASIANLTDLRRKVEKAKNTVGTSVLHIQCACPTGWRYPSNKSVQLMKEAVNSGAWLLYEYENGKIRINQKPKKLGDIHEYFALQGRFKGVSEEQLHIIKEGIVERYNILVEESS